MPKLVLIFEFPTLNGGEQSMLAVLDFWWHTRSTQGAALGTLGAGAIKHTLQFDVIALAPPAGPLADALAQRGIPTLPFECRDSTGRRRDRTQLCDDLIRLLCEVRPDAVHANSLAMGRMTGAIADRIGAPATAHLRDIIGLSAAAVADLNCNRRLIAVSAATRDFHVAQGIDPDRTVVIHNGIDLGCFQPRPKTGWLHAELGIPSDALLAATIGQIALRKGHDTLAAAAALVGFRIPDLHFLVVGARHSTKPESVAFERRLIDAFAAAGMRGRLHLLGLRSDVASLLNEIDLLVHPARQEPLGRVLLEAAASGVCIVATDVGGTREIVTDGESARLVPADDPPALARALIELATDPLERQRLAAAARARAIERFDIARAAGELRLELAP